jgi:hypothetical protein
MDKAPHVYLCVEVTQTGNSWVSNLVFNGKRLMGKTPHTILQEMMDSGAELISTHFSRAFVPHEGSVTAHIFWVRFPRQSEDKVKMLN